jgi:hypothetical protein
MLDSINHLPTKTQQNCLFQECKVVKYIIYKLWNLTDSCCN